MTKMERGKLNALKGVAGRLRSKLDVEGDAELANLLDNFDALIAEPRWDRVEKPDAEPQQPKTPMQELRCRVQLMRADHVSRFDKRDVCAIFDGILDLIEGAQQ